MKTMQFPASIIRGIVLGVVLLSLAGCGAAKKESPKSAGEGASHIVPIEAAVAQQQEMALRKTYSGSLEGEEQANIVPKISERIVTLTAHVGQSVPKGHTAVVLDKSGASSQYYQAEANYRNAEKNYQRMKSLFSEGAVSQQTLDGAQTAFDVARANFDAARSSVELSTPIAGVVTAVNASVGDLTNPGSVLVTVARINRMKVIFNINETDVTHLALGQAVTVYSETRPDIRREGKIIQLSKSADVGSRSFEVKALFPNSKDSWFKPGMFCKVDVPLKSGGPALVVPTAAVQSTGTSARVFVVRDGRAFERQVQTGITNDQSAEIVQGLAPGESVATVGVNNLRDSSYVMVVTR